MLYAVCCHLKLTSITSLPHSSIVIISGEELYTSNLSTQKFSYRMSSSSGSKKVPKIKETQEDLCDFYTALDVYTPTIPEAVTKHYMQKSGIMVADPRMVKLISLAADKFLSETIHEARQMSLLRKQGLKHAKRKVADTGDMLEMEDLERCLGQQEIVLKRKKALDNV